MQFDVLLESCSLPDSAVSFMHVSGYRWGGEKGTQFGIIEALEGPHLAPHDPIHLDVLRNGLCDLASEVL
jgi:hypothetical protein